MQPRFIGDPKPHISTIKWLQYSSVVLKSLREQSKQSHPTRFFFQLEVRAHFNFQSLQMTVDKTTTTHSFTGNINKGVAMAKNGDGVHITTIDKDTGKDKVVIDAMTGAAVGALGWGDADVIDIINKAAAESVYSYHIYFGNTHSEKLAQFYIDNSPKDAFAAALWTCSGSESNENALKISYQYWKELGKTKKTKFILRKTSYHGYTLGSLSIGSSSRSKYFGDILLPSELTIKINECYPYRFQKKGETSEEYGSRLLKELEDTIIAEDPETIISIILETLPGSSIGTAPPPANYLPGVRALCNKYDILLHLDEVMCGTGRCSKGLNAWENFLEPGQGPDIQCVGKTLGSGYVTIAGVLISPKVKKVYSDKNASIAGGQTYHGHGFNCAVALGIQEEIKKLGLTENMFEQGTYMGARLSEELLGKSKIAGDVRGLGGFWSIEFVKDIKSKEVFDTKLDIGHLVQDVCYKNGCTVMGMQGSYNGTGDHILLAPSFIVTKENIDEIVEIVVKSINEVEADLISKGIVA